MNRKIKYFKMTDDDAHDVCKDDCFAQKQRKVLIKKRLRFCADSVIKENINQAIAAPAGKLAKPIRR